MFEFNWQTWIVDVDGFVIVVDPCAGNGRERPHIQPIHQLNLPWLERFAATGYTPERVDAAFCTHLHCDHCGWNTRRLGDRWVPIRKYVAGIQIPPAIARSTIMRTYLKTASDLFWTRDSPQVSANHRIAPGVVIEPAHGHSVLRVDYKGTRLRFTRDAFHHPLQMSETALNLGGDDDLASAIATRETLRSTIASEGSYFIPAHFPAPHAGRIIADQDGQFRFVPLEQRPWAIDRTSPSGIFADITGPVAPDFQRALQAWRGVVWTSLPPAHTASHWPESRHGLECGPGAQVAQAQPAALRPLKVTKPLFHRRLSSSQCLSHTESM